MAPRRTLGKRSHGSSSWAPSPPVPQLDELWFRSLEAQARFPWFDNKSIESGRRVNLEQLHRFNVETAFGALGWLPVISYTETTCPNLVKHFYANLELEGDVEDMNQCRDLRITSYVRGVHISFNTHQLADLLGIPNDGDLVYCAPKAKGYLTVDLRQEIAHQILNPGAPMKAASLRPIPRVYSHIIQHNIVPQSGHYSELS
ncbi:hypothetical protein NE237_011001 [Protea cynaroides]|uniref:Putative plant transposon protein domain-containing protein n=1 Tax=Protea cynaroides TaxID=273540 RepID=A0A9Q0L1C0_9MAGN|nr:hypothetical protein NE237_011001 [Protea cynaroides]